MAGHSKWANIQHRKNAQDAKRGKVFTKIIREISVAARASGGDPAQNPRLRTAMDKAFGANMTRDVVERAIKKATGELEGVNYEEIRYEGYAPGGVAVIVDCLTDNHVRTVADVRHAFSKFGGNLGTDGSVAFMFRKLGVLSYPPGSDEDAITDAAIEAGADDIVTYPEDGAIDVLTDPDAFAEVRDAMVAAGAEPAQAEVTWRADNDVEVEGETAQQVVKLLRWLEDIDSEQTRAWIAAENELTFGYLGSIEVRDAIRERLLTYHHLRQDQESPKRLGKVLGEFHELGWVRPRGYASVSDLRTLGVTVGRGRPQVWESVPALARALQREHMKRAMEQYMMF